MSTIKANTLLHSDGSTTTQPSIPALDQRMAKAWVNFNGTNTVSIRDSYNVSSITDSGTGQYSINFSVALANANYSASALSSNNRWVYFENSGHTTGLCKIFTKDATPNNVYDAGIVMLQVFGN